LIARAGSGAEAQALGGLPVGEGGVFDAKDVAAGDFDARADGRAGFASL